MKTLTKNTLTLLAGIALSMSLAVTGCKKGDKGPAGADGTNGTNGNANVKLIVFGKDSIQSSNSGITRSFPTAYTQNFIDSSMVLVYTLHSNGLWYPVPGIGANSAYQMRMYYDATGVYMDARNLDGTVYSGGKQVFTKIKVLLTPASSYSGHRIKQPVDFTDYKATMSYFGLPQD